MSTELKVISINTNNACARNGCEVKSATSEIRIPQKKKKIFIPTSVCKRQKRKLKTFNKHCFEVHGNNRKLNIQKLFSCGHVFLFSVVLFFLTKI